MFSEILNAFCRFASEKKISVYSEENGFDRAIHNIENAPFRTKFDKDVQEFRGGTCVRPTDGQLTERTSVNNAYEPVCGDDFDDIIPKIPYEDSIKLQEKKEYNHQRYLRHKEAYKERSKKQYEKKKSLNHS